MHWLKQTLITLLSAVAFTFLVFGSARSPHAPPGFVVVEYWEKWSGHEAAQMQLIVNDFNRTVGRQKKIFVHYMSMTDIEQKTMIATAGGVPPDIAGLSDAQLLQFASLGALEPLDQLASSHGITAQTYMPVFWNACHYRNRLFGLVSTPGTIALIYNKQIFQQNAPALRAAGCDPNRPPRTLAELDKYAAVLDTRDASGQIDRAGYVPMQSWYHPEISFWFGGDIFDSATQRFTLDSPASLRAYQWMQSYSKKLGYRAIHDFTDSLGAFDSPENPFMVGKLAMQQQGPWMANFIANLNPSMSEVLVPTDKENTLPDRRANYAWACAPFPSAVPGLENVSYDSFDVLAIPIGARHPLAAFEFLAYVNRQDVAEKLCTLHCKNCQLAHVSASFIRNHPNPYIEVFEKLSASPNAHAPPSVPIWPEVVKELTDAAQSITLEGTDPATVLAATQQRVQEEYDRFFRIERRRELLGIN